MRAGHIGVHLALTIDERFVQQWFPALCFAVVLVVDLAAIAAAAIAVVKDQLVVSALHKCRIGAACFAKAGHGGNALECCDIPWCCAAEIDQRHAVHVAAEVQVVVVVEDHGDVVVAVPADLGWQHLVLPFIGVQGTGGDGHAVLRVVIRDELVLAFGQKAESHRKGRWHFADLP